MMVLSWFTDLRVCCIIVSYVDILSRLVGTYDLCIGLILG